MKSTKKNRREKFMKRLKQKELKEKKDNEIQETHKEEPKEIVYRSIMKQLQGRIGKKDYLKDDESR